MLYQLHHQFKNGSTNMVAQKEINTNTSKEHIDWINDVQKSHPLPEGARWLACNEHSKYFVWA